MKSLLSILTFCMILTSGVLVASTPSAPLEGGDIKVINLKKRVDLYIGPDTLSRIFIGAWGLGAIVSMVGIPIATKWDALIFTLPFFGSLSVLFLALALENPKIKCRPRGLFLPAKCDIGNYSFFEIFKFKTRYLPLIPYQEIICIEIAETDLDNRTRRIMIQIQTKSGKGYYISPPSIGKENFLKLCTIVRQENPEVQFIFEDTTLKGR